VAQNLDALRLESIDIAWAAIQSYAAAHKLVPYQAPPPLRLDGGHRGPAWAEGAVDDGGARLKCLRSERAGYLCETREPKGK
jgi:hypothetical protein